MTYIDGVDPHPSRRRRRTSARLAALAAGAIALPLAGFAAWFFWPLLAPHTPVPLAAGGAARISAVGTTPGCSANAILRLDLADLNVVAGGKRIVATEFRARDGCRDLDRPLVAFNWFTLDGLISTLRMRRYQMYAVRRVSDDAQATALVLRVSQPEVLRAPAGTGPESGRAAGQPWIHDEVTMPFYPSARALLHMLDVNRADYFAELESKRAAMRTPGYFGWQECLVDCAALATPVDPAHPLRNMLQPRLVAPLLIAHLALGRGAFDAHRAALDAELQAASLGRVAYAGWTVADPVLVAEDGSLLPPLQSAHWHDATLMVAPPAAPADAAWAARVRALPAYAALEAAAQHVAVLFYR